MKNSLVVTFLISLVLIASANFYVFNFMAEGLEAAAKFGSCLAEELNTKTDCGFDPVEQFKSPLITAGFGALMGFLNLIYVAVVGIIYILITFKRRSK